ncbi:MAG: DUF2218 domain-containing protein [Pseudomonas sp.]|uniref:DUF2218 domain-containing protein n=1 Tax=Pseudomonas sp. TaxID=306 RepID=UPI00271C68CA|nr:DUF2218 domain-containing protein [Pseudomonas sp.]MDO9619274.1 DUF2218 domain-containing protein [Pseudomonas sp.]MDP2444897.1 DUF2218 domain-containing protein [Pseudomonas sp.]MDZ4333948.1 DUF2218 domain-containing protein [Pseudomonas sp.]
MKRAQSGISNMTQRPALYPRNVLEALAAQRHALPERCKGISAPCIASSYIATTTPACYISRLCTQFAHKLPVSFDEHHGRIEFAFGLSHLHADRTGLYITALSNNAQDLDKLKHLIAAHFERFAWQAELSLDWQ